MTKGRISSSVRVCDFISDNLKGTLGSAIYACKRCSHCCVYQIGLVANSGQINERYTVWPKLNVDVNRVNLTLYD